jgi:hypothetical protein
VKRLKATLITCLSFRTSEATEESAVVRLEAGRARTAQGCVASTAYSAPREGLREGHHGGLPIAARAELASRLLEGLDAAESADTPEAVANAWEAELDRREAELGIESGFGVPAAAALERLDAKLAALQAPPETLR